MQKSFSEATRSSIRDNYGYILMFAPDRMKAGRRSLSSIENVRAVFVNINLCPFFLQVKNLWQRLRSSNQLLFSRFLTFVLVFSFGFYTSNQFSEFSLFVCFWKSPIKIRNVLFILFCRFVCFCCHHSPLINFSVKIYDLI